MTAIEPAVALHGKEIEDCSDQYILADKAAHTRWKLTPAAVPYIVVGLSLVSCRSAKIPRQESSSRE
jgi:hypothetical protein